jgi:hypothetical protein
VIQEVFIAHEHYHFTGVERYFLLIALMRDKYSLLNINEMEIW